MIMQKSIFQIHNVYLSSFISSLNLLEIQHFLKRDRRTEQFAPEEKLPFGKLRSEHMFLMEFFEGEWRSPRIVPYGPIELVVGGEKTYLMPGSLVLNYGLGSFEGGKAFLHDDGEVRTFRIGQNVQRHNYSSSKIELPKIPEEDQIQAIEALLDVDRRWVPKQEGASMYIRPVTIAVDDELGVHAGSHCIYCVILSPSGPYFPQGFSSGTMLLSDRYKRVAPKSSGDGKVIGNYANSIHPGKIAKKLGAQQVLYLDVSDKYLEEYGAMNHFQVTRDGEIIIPEFTDTILKSITACSFLELAEELRHPVRLEKIPVINFLIGLYSKKIIECGGLGTAAVVSPVERYLLDFNGQKSSPLEEVLDKVIVGSGGIGPVSRKMYELYTGIQYGRIEDKLGWMRKVERMC